MDRALQLSEYGAEHMLRAPRSGLRSIHVRLGKVVYNPTALASICIFLFLSYSFGIEMINTFIDSYSSIKNHTRFQS